MNRHDIRLLQAIRQYPSVSIILPTYRTAPENLKDTIRVKNLVKEAEDRLLQEFTWREVDSLTSRLNDLVERIDYQYTTEGLAIYVNKDFSRAFSLPFKPAEQVVVDETFATRYLVLVLALSRTLIVETDFHYPARVDETGLFLTPAEDPTAPDVIDDAVDDVIETVMTKGGKVVFVDDGVLELYQHIAMILRY